MSHDLTLPAADTLARGQIALFHELGMLCHLTQDDQRRILSLSESEWTAWRRFQGDGPRPAWPSLPDMLLRLATAAYGIAVLLDPDPLGFELTGW